MPEQLEIIQMAQSMARHAAARSAAIARNIAHADTPGYRAVDLPPFSEVYQPVQPARLRATRPGHISQASAELPRADHAARPVESPDGNTVALEIEMMKAIESRRAHDRAVAVYGKSLDILRASLGRIR